LPCGATRLWCFPPVWVSDVPHAVEHPPTLLLQLAFLPSSLPPPLAFHWLALCIRFRANRAQHRATTSPSAIVPSPFFPSQPHLTPLSHPPHPLSSRLPRPVAPHLRIRATHSPTIAPAGWNRPRRPPVPPDPLPPRHPRLHPRSGSLCPAAANPTEMARPEQTARTGKVGRRNDPSRAMYAGREK
jgi:hypothetical protein